MFAASAAMGGIGVLVAVVAGDRVLTLFFGSEYAGSLRILALVMVAGAVGYVVSAQGYAMTAARQLLPQIPLLLATAAVTTASAWWLVPRRGLAGAAEAWLLGAIFQLALSSAVMAHLGRAAKKIADLQAATSAAACSPD
jgi:O-antigen/teichoic acid export membrane protein